MSTNRSHVSFSRFAASALAASLLAPSPLAQNTYPLSERIEPATVDAGDTFGSSAAISDGIAVIGAPLQAAGGGLDAGVAYLADLATGNVLHRLVADDSSNSAFLGSAAAIDGTTAIVGARGSDVDGFNAGAAYLFDVATGAQTFKLLSDDLAANDAFGYAVAIEGTTAIVGAWGHDSEGTDAGAVYLFDTTTGMQTGKLVADDASVGDFFGIAVALEGTTALVGATGVDGVSPDVGAVYVFDVGTGVQLGKLMATDGETSDQFGHAVALSGSTALVGAYGQDEDATDAGAAYLFDVETETELQKFAPDPGVEDDLFGFSVSLGPGLALVGAPGRSAAYLYDTISGDRLTQLMDAGDESVSAGFGRAVALEGEQAVVGAYLGRANPSFNDFGGRAYIMRNLPSVAFRNGGTNPDSYRAGAAWIGGTLRFEIDVTTTGHTSALVIGFDSPVSLPLGAGQTLLCLDLMGNGELFNTGFHPGPLAEIDLAVPNVATLIGSSLCTQAIHAFGVAPFALSNAQDVVIGGCPFGPTDWAQKFFPPPGSGAAYFGWAVDAHDGVAAVCAPLATVNGALQKGAVYVIDVSTGTQLLELSDSSNGFGRSAAIDGAHVLVGAPRDPVSGFFYGGSAFLFNARTGALLFNFVGSDTMSSQQVGSSVALAGPYALAASSRDDELGDSAGAVYQFDVTTGAEVAKILASDGAAFDGFGTGLAADGTTAYVGAPGAGSGAVYVIDTVTGTETFKLEPSDPTEVFLFGSAVDVSGDTVAIGAYVNGDTTRPVAYAFDAVTGMELAKFEPDVPGSVLAVAAGDGIVAIGATSNVATFVYDAQTGVLLDTLRPGCDGSRTGSFGITVAVDGSDVLVGARGDDTLGFNSGSVVVFE